MRKIFFVGILICALFGGATLFSQSTNWADYGLTEESVKYLSTREKEAILRSLTPEQTQKKQKEEMQKTGMKSVSQFPGVGEQSPIVPSDNPEIVSCFDYYTFGSIDADMTSQTLTAVAGMTMDFAGEIRNNNPYPVLEGTLYVKIFKDTGGEKNPNGPDVVDQFIAMDNITLPANGSVPASFTWQVPAYATSGEYRLVTYFTSNKKFNLLGLSFTDDIVGNSFEFAVSGEQKSTLIFNKSSVIINESPYYFAAYPPRISEGEDATISLSIQNTTGQKQVGRIIWRLYRWDSMDPDNFIREFTTSTDIGANAATIVKFSIPEADEPVYLLVGELSYQDTKSIVNIRYVREGVEKARLNFPSIMAYPIKAGESSTFFTCLHNSGQSAQVPNNTVVLEIRDKKGKIIESYTYEGAVSGEMMAVKKDFTPKKNLDIFSLHASLYTDGKLVDQSMTEYDCAILDPAQCLSEEEEKYDVEQGAKNNLTGILISILLIVIGVVCIVIKKRRNIIVSLLFVFSVGCVFYAPVADAKSTTWNKTINKDFYYFWNGDERVGNWGSGWELALKNPTVTITYNVEIKNLDTGGLVGNNDAIPVGTKLRLKFIKHKYTDISWVGTGFSSDSPYGAWKDKAAPPAEDRCKEKDFLRNVTWNISSIHLKLGVYIPLTVDHPTKTISGKQNMSCENLTGNESDGYSMDCTVTKAGKLNPEFHFSSTTGKFYHQYYEWRNGVDSGCFGNSIPLKTENQNPYLLEVPEKTASYTFTAFVPNRAPTPPTITGPTMGYISTAYTFSLRATDPDTGDTIKYAIDWDSNGTVDQYLPSSGYVNSGVIQNTSKSWGTTGAKTFQAKTIDNSGAASGWTSHTITLSNPPVNGTCGTAAKTYSSTAAGYNPDIQCSTGMPSKTTFPDLGASVTWTCSGTNGGAPSPTCTAMRTAAPIIGACGTANNKTYGSTIVAYTPDTQCTSGGASNTSFPSVGGYMTWTCSGTNGGAPSPMCTASRAAAPILDYCLNFEGVQSNVPAGFIRNTAGDCICTGTVRHNLTITKAGTGTGSVSSSPVGTACGENCTQYALSTSVTLSSAADVGSVFVGWSGDADCADGTVIMDADKTCVATFTPTVTGKPNLTASIPQGNATAVVNAPLDFEALIINKSTTDISISFDYFFQTAKDDDSNDEPDTGTEVDILPGGTIADGLQASPGGTTGKEATTRKPFAQPGKYLIRLCADKTDSNTSHLVSPRTDKVDESNEGDNCGAWKTITVSPGGGNTCSTNSPTAHSSICPDGPNPTSINQSGILVGTCSASVECDWTCDAGYTKSGSICTPISGTRGVCGTADGQKYNATAGGYGADTQCRVGAPSSLDFPAVGSSVSWTCIGSDGVETPCAASRGYACGGSIPVGQTACPNTDHPTSAGVDYIEVNKCARAACTYGKCPLGQEWNNDIGSCEISYHGCFADGVNTNPIPTLGTYSGYLMDTITGNAFGYLLSDSNRIMQNQTFLTRLSQNINTYIVNQYYSRGLEGLLPNVIDITNNSQAALLKGSSMNNPNGYYYYKDNGGTIIIKASEITGQRVVLAEGVDIYIEGDITYNTTNSSLVIIVRKYLGQGGNIYVDSDVGRIDGTLIADGALMNNGVNWISSPASLTKPLVINGRLLTHNTRGGSLDTTLQARTDTGECGDNSSTSACSTLEIAAAQDLERFRLTTDTTGQCTLYVTGTNPIVVDVLSGITF